MATGRDSIGHKHSESLSSQSCYVLGHLPDLTLNKRDAHQREAYQRDRHRAEASVLEGGQLSSCLIFSVAEYLALHPLEFALIQSRDTVISTFKVAN